MFKPTHDRMIANNRGLKYRGQRKPLLTAIVPSFCIIQRDKAEKKKCHFQTNTQQD